MSKFNTPSLLAVSRAIRFAFAASILASGGCARNHYYIDPNGQVTTVGHNPIWGRTKVTPETVQVTEVPTTVAGAKIVSKPSSQTAIAGGVVNPAIPEAVVVQQPAGAANAAEPGLLNTGDESGASSTQISGGIKKIAKSNEGTIE